MSNFERIVIDVVIFRRPSLFSRSGVDPTRPMIKSGADDYVLKDRLKRLPSAIKKAIDKADLKRSG